MTAVRLMKVAKRSKAHSQDGASMGDSGNERKKIAKEEREKKKSSKIKDRDDDDDDDDDDNDGDDDYDGGDNEEEEEARKTKKTKKKKKEKKLKKEKKMKKIKKEKENDMQKSDNVETVSDGAETSLKSPQPTNDAEEAQQNQAETDAETLTEKPESETELESTKKKRKRKESKLSKRKEEREALMAKVPKVDQDGISYTKIQIRRMMKRVKKGLTPVETPQEEQERLRRDAQLRKEEEAELAGMLYIRDKEKDETEMVEDNNSHEDAQDPDQEQYPVDHATDKDTDGADQKKSGAEFNDKAAESSINTEEPPKKKKCRGKPVPNDYICQACKNEHSPRHWIYDCPKKVTMRGTNNISKREKGIHDPDEKKVFVSGLPFDTKRKDLENMFQSCGKMLHCKILTFPDTGRCKGQAFVTFDSENAASLARGLNGTSISNEASGGDGKKSAEQKKKELKLKVTKVLNRQKTKRGSRSN